MLMFRARKSSIPCKTNKMKKVAIITGYRCNNNCRFCYDANKRDYPSLTTDQTKQRLTEARNRGCDYIDFLGGEFTIRKDALELIRFAKELGYKVIALTTNGRVLSYSDIAEKFIEAGLTDIIYSIHGHTPELHDFQTRVSGSFKQLVKGIKNTQELGIPFFANITLTKLNYKHLPQIAQFLVDLGCVNAEFIYVDPTGAAYNDFNDIVPTVKEIASYIRQCLDIGMKNRIPHWHVRYYPMCYLFGYEDYISEAHDPFENVEHFGPEFENYDVESSRRSIARVKSLRCVSCKYVNRCEGIWKVYAEKRGLEELVPVKDVPEEVKVELTHRCNLDCDFCFNKKNPSKREPATDEVKSVIDNIYASGISAVRFTGGEPFLREDLGQILKYAKSKGLYVILNTNGALIKEDVLKYVDDLLISFHDIREAKEKGELFKRLSYHKLVLRCCTIATKDNIKSLEDFYIFMEKQPIDDWFLLRVVPNQSNLKPITREDIKRLVDKVLLFNKKYKRRAIISNAVPYCSYEPEKVRSACVGGRNDDGHTRIVVDTKGHIKPSYFSTKILGDTTKDSIIDCWNSEYMRSVRELQLVPEECNICRYVKECKGGLRFAAGLVNKGDNALDPLARGIRAVQGFRVLLINPQYHDFFLPIEPLSLEYIAAVLEKNLYKVKIVDLSVEKADLNNVIREFEPDIVGISNMTLQVNEGYRIGNLIKREFPNIYLVYGGIHQPFVYGGMHSAAFPKEPFEKGSADFVIPNEGEKPFLELVNALESGKEIGKQNIKGLCYKKGEEIILNTERNLFESIDELPFPARHLVNIRKYKNDIHILPYAKELAIDVITSRGCPNNCGYCTSPLFYGRNIRVRSAKNILGEINDIVNNHQVKYVHFHDDCFLLNPKVVEELCKGIIREKLGIKWICLASINSLTRTKHLFGLMNRAGCVGVEVGLENADADVLAKMNKNQNVEDVLVVDKLLKKDNIIPLYLTISFYIGETVDTARRTAELLSKISNENLPVVDYLKSVHLPYSFGQFATPYPNTRFYDIAEKEGICFTQSWDDYNRQKVNFIPYSFLHDIPSKTKELSKEDFYKEINRFKDAVKYYLNDPDLIGFSDYNNYLDFLYRIYDNIDGSKNVTKLLGGEDLRYGCLALKFLSMFSLAGSKK